ncbi:FAD binding domain protein [Myriangium duriaei CBS 260.36]|uniref:FAD binding domain protein n=1 Tax=Myriangium duriaei CBS 260.36 TaxID=1168546 RepID=A0A9P4MT94_9PEZI|nr:FAD binding domain protein [Myriangium duriaei CBS 260.36]
MPSIQINGGFHRTNGHTNGIESDGAGLHILIVGAGIAGLSAAIGLRDQGHRVEIFEQSQFAKETGAAVHIAPNAHGILKRLGIDLDAIGANKMERVPTTDLVQLTEYDSGGQLRRSIDLNEDNKKWQHEWRLAHRVQIHDALKRTATNPTGKGHPASLHLGSGVAAVDPIDASITLNNGTTVKGDIILAADGVHSVCRAQIPGGDVQPFGSGKSAFRFIIARETALSSPATQAFVERPGELVIWYAKDRRVVMYPTANNSLLNFVCIHPEEESDAGAQWNTNMSLASLLRVYQDFDPGCISLLKMAEPSSLKAWKLLDMAVLPTWINHSLALLGDAAHPFLPHQGQGAGVAMEDAATLAVVLERGLSPSEVPARLKLYEEIRKTRANRIQEYSRLAGVDLKADSGAKFDMIEYTNYNFGHDEFDNSTQKLREYTWAKTPNIYWRMPIAFGPMPGPRQSHLGIPRDAVESTFTSASIKFKTSRTVLQNLFPPGVSNYRFTSPGTVAHCSFSCTTLNKMEWLGGSGYSHIGLYIHGVEYQKADGKVIRGTYMPILFESLTDPIVSGREELGMPKLYTAIDIYRGTESYRIKTGWQGSQWGNFQLHGLKYSSDPATATGKVSGEDDDGILVHRYVPKVGRSFKGEAEAQYSVFVPFAEDMPQPVTKRVWKADTATIDIDALGWDALPTLHHIISRLKEIPIFEVVSAKVVEGDGVPDVGAARRVE